MARPENSPSKAVLIAELTQVQGKLEKADENENPIERFNNQDALLEQYDWLKQEIGSAEFSE